MSREAVPNLNQRIGVGADRDKGISAVRMTPQWTTGMLKGFGRRPFAGAAAGRGAGVRKPRKEETAGRKRRGLVGRDLWGLEGRVRIARVAARAGGG